MLVHTVLMKTRPNATESELAELTSQIRDLARTCAGSALLAVGPNVTHEPLDQGYSFGFVLQFTDRGSLDAYHANPAHLAASDVIRDLAAEILVFDFEN